MSEETFDQFIQRATPEQIRKLYDTLKEVDDKDINFITEQLFLLTLV